MRWATKSSTPASAALRHLGEQRAAGQRERQDDCGGEQGAALGAAAGLRDHSRARRAGIDRKGAREPRDDIGRAEAQEIAVDIGVGPIRIAEASG